jgi:hypothetical protein
VRVSAAPLSMLATNLIFVSKTAKFPNPAAKNAKTYTAYKIYSPATFTA